jgi:hypothetical protein
MINANEARNIIDDKIYDHKQSLKLLTINKIKKYEAKWEKLVRNSMSYSCTIYSGRDCEWDEDTLKEWANSYNYTLNMWIDGSSSDCSITLHWSY